jgi:hypothetical protein
MSDGERNPVGTRCTAAGVSVDDEPPQSTITISQTPDSKGPARIVIKADDRPLDRTANSDQDGVPVLVKSAAGVKWITFSTDTGIPPKVSTAEDGKGRRMAEFQIDHEGVTTITFFATDLLGHQEQARTATVIVKK